VTDLADRLNRAAFMGALCRQEAFCVWLDAAGESHVSPARDVAPDGIITFEAEPRRGGSASAFMMLDV
jgi:hypothetical protein